MLSEDQLREGQVSLMSLISTQADDRRKPLSAENWPEPDGLVVELANLPSTAKPTNHRPRNGLFHGETE